MKCSPELIKFVPAFLTAQVKMTSARKDAKNPQFKSTYSNFESILEATKEPLNDQEIVILQPTIDVVGEDGTVRSYVETILMHISGEFISAQTLIICKKPNDPQALGSAVTYAKRYGLQSLVALPSGDDDGEAAMARDTQRPVARAPQPTTGGARKPAPRFNQ